MRLRLFASLLLATACDGLPATEASAIELAAAPAPLVIVEPDRAVETTDTALAQFEVPPHRQGGARGKWKRPAWIDADRDCQDTRNEVLIAEAIGPIEFADKRKCKVRSGKWRCPYTGRVITDPHDLDVDHMVPLKNVYEAGGSAWSNEVWRRYANDLEYPDHLVAVASEANQSKGAHGPDVWLPPLASYQCVYVRDFAAIKQRWGVGATRSEADAIETALAGCAAGKVPPLPEPVAKPVKVKKPNQAEPAGECCRTCHKGKACGDTCISRDSSCAAGPGCACDG